MGMGFFKGSAITFWLSLLLAFEAWAKHSLPLEVFSRSTATTESLSSEDEAFIDAFCENPQEAVCKTFRVKDLNSHLKDVTQELNSKVMRSMALKYGAQALKSFSPLQSFPTNLARAVERIGAAAEEYRKSPTKTEDVFREAHLLELTETIEAAAGIELGETLDHSGVILEALVPTLHAAVSVQAVERSDRKMLVSQAREALRQVKFYTPSQFLKAGGASINIRVYCGMDLLQYNSFFVRDDPEEPNAITGVVVCPGVYLAAIAAKRCGEYSPSFLRDTLVSILSHELGHRIDYRRVLNYAGTPTPYDDFGKCVHTHLWKQGRLKDFLEDDFNEITADYWSAETLAELVRTEKLGRTDLVRILRYSSTPYCDSAPAESDPHPPGRFRLDLKGRNPRLRHALRCKRGSSKNVPLCGTEGRSTWPEELLPPHQAPSPKPK